jgi:hypothetical protein
MCEADLQLQNSLPCNASWFDYLSARAPIAPQPESMKERVSDFDRIY